MNIAGIQYQIVATKTIEVRGERRTVITLKRPAGRRTYEVVVYANGVMSEVV